MVKRMRGISPVIATVIILAVTIAIAIAVVGWVMGVFRSSTKAQVQLRILPNSTATTTTVTLWIKNVGSTPATVTGAKVVGANCEASNLNTQIPPGGVGKVTIPDCNLVGGITYNVEVYTADGSVFTGTVVATEAGGTGGG